MQLGGGLVFAIGIPSLILWLQSGPTAFTPVVEFVLLSSTLAFLMGTWQYRSIAPFPGVEGSANIISSFTISYGLMAVLLLLLRLEYTRMLVLSSWAPLSTSRSEPVWCLRADQALPLPV